VELTVDASARTVLVSEARELLTDMERALLEMEVEGATAERINAAFRAAHTIKGSAGLFGLTLITSFTQTLESVLDRVRNHELPADAELVSTLLACCDYIGQLVTGIEQENEQHDPDPDSRRRLLHALRSLLGGDAAQRNESLALARALQRESPRAGGHFHLSLRFGKNVLKNGLDPLSFITYLREIGVVIYVYTLFDNLPAAGEIDPALCYLGFEVGLKTSADQRAIEDAFALVRDECELRILPPQSNVAEYIQIIKALPAARRKLGELLVASGALGSTDLDTALTLQTAIREGPPPRLGEVLVQEQLVAAPVVAAALSKQRQGEERRGSEQRMVKVDATKLDQLINLIGELVIASEGARITAGKSQKPELLEAMGRVGQIVEQVRDRALDMRMIAIGEVFQRFPRVVRDVSRELGKQIELTITGAECELDKSMVDKLSDPLIHIVRNAIDHGIEPIDARVAAGKRPQGRLALHAFHESGYIVIEIKDDGRGLQRDKILAKAIERGLIAEDAVLSDAEIYQLLFLPGFSTAQVVTDLSGRGVGMDVVKRNVEQLRGEIDIASRPGRGTRFRIRLPLTLAIIDGFQVALGDTIFVVPLESVVECVGMVKTRTGRQNLFNLRGDPLPYLQLRDVFQLPPFSGTRESMVVVQHGAQRVGLVVDRLVGDMQAVIKPLGRLFRGIKAVSSSTILGDGAVALILDVPTLVARASANTAPPEHVRTDPARSVVH
jgi:two-component system chemotaxis sensor kinase CheA